MAVNSEKAVKSYLLDFGLNDKEVVIYLTLLKTGPSTIMDLSRKTGIKRSTTHNNVEELIKKGLVSQTNYGERRMAVAEDPEKLKFLLEQRKWDVNKLEKIMPDIVKSIYDTVPGAKETTKVEVKYYEGHKGVQLIYKEAFGSKELRSYVNLAEVSKGFPDNGQLFLDAQKKSTSLVVYEILDNSDESLASAKLFSKNQNFKYKVSPMNMNLSAVDILMFDNKVALVNFKDSITGVIIDNKDYYENTKAIFDFMWNILK
ncbi:MAG: helix-turn-helix domain-containing protein [Candidatus Dojkabacteria bacterium]